MYLLICRWRNPTCHQLLDYKAMTALLSIPMFAVRIFSRDFHLESCRSPSSMLCILTPLEEQSRFAWHLWSVHLTQPLFIILVQPSDQDCWHSVHRWAHQVRRLACIEVIGPFPCSSQYHHHLITPEGWCIDCYYYRSVSWFFCLEFKYCFSLSHHTISNQYIPCSEWSAARARDWRGGALAEPCALRLCWQGSFLMRH